MFLWFHFQAFFSSNASALASRKSSPRVTNEGVQKAVSVQLLISVESGFQKIHSHVTYDIFSFPHRLLH
jgi:hypothetical protein